MFAAASIAFLNLGCAGGGKTTTTGKGGSSATGIAGTTGTTGAAGTTSTTGVAGTTGAAGTSATGVAGTTSTTGVAGTTGAGGTTAAAGTTGTAGSTGAAGTGSFGNGDASTDAVCQSAQYKFVPKIPIVYLLVDRSGSMFHCLTADMGATCATPSDTSWGKFKEAVRTVVTTLDKQVKFGFTTIWGTNPTQGGMCPSLQGTLTDNVAPALNNATAVMTKYDSLPFPGPSTQPGVKYESPASESIQAVGKALTTITDPGDKYVLFVTDGQPDYCDDSQPICATDSIVGYLQANKAAGITTIVLGIQTKMYDLSPGALQAFANAGAGEPTLPPVGTGLDANAFWDQCQGVAPWNADRTALGKGTGRGTTLGTYMTTSGPTKPYMPSATDQTQLVTQLSQALSGVKSCTFDLGDVGGKSIKVDTTKLSQAHVKIEGAEIPLSATDGWNVDATAPSQLVLTGTACATWRMPDNNNIDFQFPCSTIIFE